MNPLVETRGVTRRFGDVVAVDGVSLDVRPGEVVGLLGANGAGKSTLIRLVLGLLPADGGSIALFGGPPSRSARSRLGYVPQSLGLYPDLTVAENVAFVADAFGGPRPTLPDDLAVVAGRRIGDVSLGIRRRVAFAAALSHEPELLILDEPTSGVGPIGRAELWTTIAEAAAAGTGVLVSTHYMEEAEQCDRLVMLVSGRVVATGSASDIVGSVESVEIRADDWPAALGALDAEGMRPSLVGTRLRVTGRTPDEVRDALARRGVNGEVGPVRAGFEEAFVALSAS
jgi:ABC-2 type transport system ATP-binding protein